VRGILPRLPESLLLVLKKCTLSLLYERFF
jgi:hypothetical protein